MKKIYRDHPNRRELYKGFFIIPMDNLTYSISDAFGTGISYNHISIAEAQRFIDSLAAEKAGRKEELCKSTGTKGSFPRKRLQNTA